MGEDRVFQKLIKACQRNQRGAQKELYRQYYAYVMTVCLHYSKDTEEAKDILNESFFKVFIHLKKYKVEQAFKPWLRRIIVNTAIDYLRKYNKKITSPIENDHLKIQDSTLSGFDQLALEDILELVQKLPPMYRSVFNLYIMEGFTHVEISKKLGISIGGSKSNLSRAKSKLREMIVLQEAENIL